MIFNLLFIIPAPQIVVLEAFKAEILTTAVVMYRERGNLEPAGEILSEGTQPEADVRP
jgi:hypothetical protein